MSPENIEQLDEMLEDLYTYLTQSPLGTSASALSFSELAETGLLYIDTNDELQSLSDVGALYINVLGVPASLSAATGNALLSGGVGAVPAFGQIGLTTHVTGTLPVGNGGTGSATTFTTGSVIFAGASGIYTQDNAGLFFDSTNDRLGIGVASPTDAVDVRGTSPIIGNRFSSSAGFGALRFYEGLTLASSVQAIGSTFATVGRRQDLELVTLSASGDVVFRPNDVETIRVPAGGGIIVGATNISETDIAKIDGITNGTALANKALVADANIDIAGLRDLLATRTLQGNVFSLLAAGVTTGTQTVQTIHKTTTAIPDATVTAVATVTIPNAAHSASIRVFLTGYLGAGGAVGANEASGTVGYDIAISRTAGVDTAKTVSAVYGSATATVTGGATITVLVDTSALTGASGATQTFTIQVTITRGSGSSTNHVARTAIQIINHNATGITVT